MGLRFETLTGEAIAPHVDDLARLRIRVFAEYPYLYEGSAEYEARYLSAYRESEGAVVVAGFDDDRLVGAATGTPMRDHHDEFSQCFAGRDYRMADLFYLAESVLLPEYRGQGAGHRFFDLREAHARKLGFTHAAFCGIVRPDDHPARPAGHVPLDGFWRRRGYEKLDGAIAHFSWKEHGEERESPKPLQFWIRDLR